MVAMKTTGLALTLAGVAAAQSSVVSIFFPAADPQTLLGSVIKSDSSKTTMAIACPTDADVNDCGLDGPLTVTVGPSTFHVQETYESTSVIIDCKVSGTTAANCAETYVGPYGLIATETATGSFDSSITSTVTSTTLGPTDITFMAITLTDSLGDDSGSSTTDSSGASSSSAAASATDASGASSSASASSAESSAESSAATSAASSATSSSASSSATSGSSGTSGSSSSGSATPTGSSNNGASGGDSRMLALSAMGAGLVGCAMLLL
ncbi:hypothetical protein PV08_01619 [Exophiala spinifera]|uniref:GPI anchored protein n=1 Tax=Exophiala spinifera TaxID=91928 RepID=A0A0D2BRN1_9EURO|nr:uncharacterized protein PV08_01619 [Exophiala spinifera]KIW21040.1 hypothetical protein PV08_01619 [Exophiala spinifera]